MKMIFLIQISISLQMCSQVNKPEKVKKWKIQPQKTIHITQEQTVQN